MTTTKTTTFSGGLLWFGAAISIAEILTGSFFAPLGFQKGLMAILLGHIIGCGLLYLVGLIGAKSNMYAMESSKISFGEKGSYMFSALNILQLIGWTGVMIISTAKALSAISTGTFGSGSDTLWCIVVGVLIIAWVLFGMKNLGKVNLVAVGALFILTIILSGIIFKSHGATMDMGTISFGMALELSIAMPLSWLPLISDYTKQAKHPERATRVSVLSYFFGSTWMYTIGLGAAIYAGTSDIGTILMGAGLGVVAIIVVVLSTVTTTFLDVYSAGISFINISKKGNEKLVACVVGIIGILIAIFTPIEQYQNFLYLIGSAFAPMAAILITDYFIIGKKQITKELDWINLSLWFLGVVLYQLFLKVDFIIGSTLPVMIIIGVLTVLMKKIGVGSRQKDTFADENKRKNA